MQTENSANEIEIPRAGRGKLRSGVGILRLEAGFSGHIGVEWLRKCKKFVAIDNLSYVRRLKLGIPH